MVWVWGYDVWGVAVQMMTLLSGVTCSSRVLLEIAEGEVVLHRRHLQNQSHRDHGDEGEGVRRRSR